MRIVSQQSFLFFFPVLSYKIKAMKILKIVASTLLYTFYVKYIASGGPVIFGPDLSAAQFADRVTLRLTSETLKQKLHRRVYYP